MADTSDIKGYFNTLAEDWNKNYSRSNLFSERLEKVKKLTSDIQLKGKIVLDIGCGSGMISSYFCEQRSSVYGIDISENMIQQANSYLQSRNLKATLGIGDATNLQFPDNYFDVITCVSVLEWLDKDIQAVREIRRVLKNNGIAIISVPNKRSLLRIVERLYFKLRQIVSPYLNLKTGYLAFQKNQYTPNEFDRLCEINSLRKIDSLYYVTPYSRFNLFKKLSNHRLFGMIYFVKLQKVGD
ncbi:methyltransferase domain-containing protein [bacterium]|nr:methyltransferase domain-containing protein [bacterium]